MTVKDLLWPSMRPGRSVWPEPSMTVAFLGAEEPSNLSLDTETIVPDDAENVTVTGDVSKEYPSNSRTE